MDQLKAACSTSFSRKLSENGLFPLRSTGLSLLQVNVGKNCNLSCKHCHMEAGPGRSESMGRDIMSQCLVALAEPEIQTLDITGGAPELNPHLPWFIEEASRLNKRVMVRTNLTALNTGPCSHLMEFYTSRKVTVIASLPYYTCKYTDRQRGQGVFDASIRVLKHLNKLGYGREQSELVLNLVHNPGGAFPPPTQQAIETDFRRELGHRHGIFFNKLFTITNAPVGRFLKFLIDSDNLNSYMGRLEDLFNTDTVGGVMCRNQISVRWDGQLYDCDFNLAQSLGCSPEVPGHIKEFDFYSLKNRPVSVGNHCYACTAGAGSSCGGAVCKDGN